jgi:hypothetical protein
MARRLGKRGSRSNPLPCREHPKTDMIVGRKCFRETSETAWSRKCRSYIVALGGFGQGFSSLAIVSVRLPACWMHVMILDDPADVGNGPDTDSDAVSRSGKSLQSQRGLMLTYLEKLVIDLGHMDAKREIARARHEWPWLSRSLGQRPPNGLSNPALETLRLTAIRLYRSGWLTDACLRQFHGAGYTDGHLALIKRQMELKC